MTVQAVATKTHASVRHKRGTFPWLPLVVLGLASALFLAIVGELGLRIAELRATNLAGLRCVGTNTVLQGQKGLYVLDSFAGYTMRPDTCVRLRSTEYDGVLRTNAQGFVGPELSVNKAAGEFRILVLGDSYAVGGQVPYEQTFPAVLEQRLHDMGYSNVRVVDGGVGGYTTFNEAGLLREKKALFQPDLVVVAAFLGNDVAENVLAVAAGYRQAPEHPKGMTWGRTAAKLFDESGTWFPRNHLPASEAVPGPWNAQDPLPEPVGNEAPGMAPPVVQPQALSLAESGRRVAHGVWDGLRANSLLLGKLFGVPIDPSVTTAPGSLPLSVDQKRLNLSSFEWTILRDVPRTYWLDVAWPLFGRYLNDIRVSAAPAPVLVLVIPDMAQFDDQMHARSMFEFRFTDDEVDWARPQRELAAQAQSAGLPVLDLLPMFQSRSDREQLYLRQDTHFSAFGHATTAEALVEYLRTSGWLRAPN